MANIVLYTKSYSKDLERLKVSIDSIKKHNIDNIPYYVSVPSSDINLFKNSIDISYVNLISDEDILQSLEKESWKKQQIIKSSFWKLQLCDNYIMLDSDSYFIKDFHVSDFMHESGNPYTVMHQQKDLFSWTSKNKQFLGFDPFNSFVEERKVVMSVFDRKGKIYDFGPGPIVWSSKVWKSLEDNYLIPNNLTFSKLIDYVSSEFSWYGEYLLVSKEIDLYPIEPIFKFFHFEKQYIDYKNREYLESHFAENYFGVVMQSNWGAPLKY
jgi:hypothetical protein